MLRRFGMTRVGPPHPPSLSGDTAAWLSSSSDALQLSTQSSKHDLVRVVAVLEADTGRRPRRIPNKPRKVLHVVRLQSLRGVLDGIVEDRREDSTVRGTPPTLWHPGRDCACHLVRDPQRIDQIGGIVGTSLELRLICRHAGKNRSTHSPLSP